MKRNKLPLAKSKLFDVLRNVVKNNDVEVDKMRHVLKKVKLESLGLLEKSPSKAVASMVTSYLIYGDTEEHVMER